MNTENNNGNGDVLTKLQKLLRLSGSSNEHEAALALARAQELAIKHGVELATVRAYDEEVTAAEDQRIGRVLRQFAKRSLARTYIAGIIKRFFGVHIVYAGGNNNVWFIGSKGDIEFSKYVWDFLEGEFKRLFLVACNRHGWMPSDRRARTSYYYGLYQGLHEKLHADRAAAEARAVAERAAQMGKTGQEVANAYALAVRNQALAVKAAVKSFFPRLTHSKNRRVTIGNNSAMTSGIADGQRINLNRPLQGAGGPVGRLK